jgi:hypothetical protein
LNLGANVPTVKGLAFSKAADLQNVPHMAVLPLLSVAIAQSHLPTGKKWF